MKKMNNLKTPCGGPLRTPNNSIREMLMYRVWCQTIRNRIEIRVAAPFKKDMRALRMHLTPGALCKPRLI